ncbi:tRNA-specific 2-thiouridylase MnmA [Striga asiatica]|uniref:tRNA-specific 2-thiouridylase MnmA n=1 Tax=Striga asiatica TaxID=4170 RepID=A0A5A7QML0_STRAF|nr:tRNA-specific 2-thiouridylase MnmA [Striga asiatica]
MKKLKQDGSNVHLQAVGHMMLLRRTADNNKYISFFINLFPLTYTYEEGSRSIVSFFSLQNTSKPRYPQYSGLRFFILKGNRILGPCFLQLVGLQSSVSNPSTAVNKDKQNKMRKNETDAIQIQGIVYLTNDGINISKKITSDTVELVNNAWLESQINQINLPNTKE